MYVIIIGMGQVGRHVLRTLEVDRHNVVAVDVSADVVRDVEEHHDVATLLGYGASPRVLKQAGAARADLVVSVTNNDEVNLLAAIAAKQLGARRVVARVQGDDWAACTNETGVQYSFMGVDVIINPRVLLAEEITKIARSHGALEVIDLAADRIELVKMNIDEGSSMVNQPLSTLSMPEGTIVAAFVREGRVTVPGGADILMPGDEAYIMGLPEKILDAEDLFSTQREARRVTILGGGVIGKTLAKPLARDGTRVTIIEKLMDRATALSETLDNVTVLCGDGTNLDLLEEEEIGRSDLFVAVSREDEVNLMACLLAKRIGVDRTIALCHRPDYLELYRQLGVDITLSPRLVASDHVLRYSRSAEVKSLTLLEQGKAEVLEMVALSTCRAVGVPIRSRQVQMPRGAIIGAIVGPDRAIIPRGDDVILPGETVIILTTHEARAAVSKLFKGA